MIDRLLGVDRSYKYLEGYRKTDFYHEVERVMATLSMDHTELICWQTKGKERVIHHMKLGDLNPHEEEIKFIPCNAFERVDDFDVKHPLNIHTRDMKFVCQVKIVYQGLRHLFILPPKAVHIKEQRRIPRIDVRTQNKKIIFEKQKLLYEFPVIDISQSGLAFMISSGPAKYFSYPKDEIKIQSLLDRQLEDSLKGSLVYIKELSDLDWDNKRQFRVGVKFENEVDISTID